MAGVDFASDYQPEGRNDTNMPSGQMSDGGPIMSPTEYQGRSAGVNPVQEEGMPPRGDILDCPADY